MTLVIYTDPHIGLARSANTTPRSRGLLKESISSVVKSIIGESYKGEQFTCDGSSYICLGDLFDTYSNPESVISEGEEIIIQTDLTLAGNHDVVADADEMGSMEFLKSRYPDKVCYASFGVSYAEIRKFGRVFITSVPHVTTQELFNESLDAAFGLADEADSKEVLTILCLHCNFDSPYEMTETSLNLLPEQVEKLLGVYDYIFLGHEHQPRDLYDGRLVILGNTHPTGFSDISSKRIAIFDDDYNLTFKEVWNVDEGYAEYEHDAIPDTVTAQFVRIRGRVQSADLAATSKAVANLWKTSPQLLALRSEIKVADIEQAEEGLSEATAETLPAIIARELEADPPMKAMWEEFTQLT